jgi:hypothetical protein
MTTVNVSSRGMVKDGAFNVLTAAVKANVARVDTLVAADNKLTPGAGFKGADTLYHSSIVKQGDIYKTTIFIDLTDAKSSTTDLDIIGTSGVSHIGQVTAAKCGTIFYGQITCLETPATGADDIDFYSAVEGTGAFDGGIAALDETELYAKASAAAGAAATPIIIPVLPAADEYLYMVCGEGSVPATYTAGQFLIELFGV